MKKLRHRIKRHKIDMGGFSSYYEEVAQKPKHDLFCECRKCMYTTRGYIRKLVKAFNE
jgi:hypothetical protein